MPTMGLESRDDRPPVVAELSVRQSEPVRIEMACAEIERATATVQRLVTSTRYAVMLMQEVLAHGAR